MKQTIFWVFGLTALFLVLFHYKAATDIITSVTTSVSNTISKLQGGV